MEEENEIRTTAPVVHKIRIFRRIMSIIRYFIPLLGFMATDFFGRFLGSEGTAIIITGHDLVFFAIILVGWIFLFRLLYVYARVNQKSRFLLKLLYLAIFLAISVFFHCIRCHFLSYWSLCLSGILCSYVIQNVSGGEIIPYSSRNSESEDSFELEVLAEPWPVTHNIALESSMKNRIIAMENSNSIFLLDKEKGVYWSEIKTALDQAPSQEEYTRLLEFESRDLQIRELKHDCFRQFQHLLRNNPALAENAAYNPHEAFIDFLTEKRLEFDVQGFDVELTDKREIQFLTILSDDLQRHGQSSENIKYIIRGLQ